MHHDHARPRGGNPLGERTTKTRIGICVALASWCVASAALGSGSSAEMVIVSPPAFTNLWQQYVDYREETHPGLSIAIANTADIYAAQPEAVAKGDCALAIHRHLESLYDGGRGALRIVLLGAGAPGRTDTGSSTNWHSFTNKFLPFDPATQIPSRYPIVGSDKAAHAPSDMYFACLDKADGAAEVWDCDGDGVYMATMDADGTISAYENGVDWVADLQVMRVPLQPLLVETTGGQNSMAGDVTAVITAAQQMENFLSKLRYLESPAWKGAGRHALVGDTSMYGYVDLTRGETSTEYAAEHEFFDGYVNSFAPEGRPSPVRNETILRYRAWQFMSGTRASGAIDHCVGQAYALPGVYGSDTCGLAGEVASQSDALAGIAARDYDSMLMLSHGWARAAAPAMAVNLLNGVYTGCSRIYFAPEPCDTGMMDYANLGQTVTNAVCLGAAAVFAPHGGAAASFNNTREGLWLGLDNGVSSTLEKYLLAAAFTGNCTNLAFDVDNPRAAAPVTAGEALLIMRRHAVEHDIFETTGRYAASFVELNGFGDPLVTLSPQPDAEDDLSSSVNRVLALTANPSVATTNAAAVLRFGANVNSVAGSGILRATVRTEIASPALDWSVAGGMGRAVAFANPGGRLAFSGTAKRYVGTQFTNVGEIAVNGSNTTVDFGLRDDNATTCPVPSLTFASPGYGTNILRNANADAPSGFFAATAVGVAGSVLRAETTSAFPAALTNAELRIAPNPLWSGVTWDKPITFDNGRLTVAAAGFSFADGATLNVVGDGSFGHGGSLADETGAESVAASGGLAINLSNGAWFSVDKSLKAAKADGSLTVRGHGVLYLPHLPLAGFTNLVVGSGTTLILPGSATDAVLLISGGTTSSVTFEGAANVYRLADEEDLTESYWGEYMNNPVARGGSIVPDGASSVADPPYARTLSSATEDWFNSSAWTGNGKAFTDTWANSATYAGTVNLAVSDSAADVVLNVEEALSMSALVVADAAGAAHPGDLTIQSANAVTFGAIDAIGYSGALSLAFDLGTASLTANVDTRVLGANGSGTLTIPAGGRATLYNGDWPGAISNAGVLKRVGETELTFSLATMVPGTNGFAKAKGTGDFTASSGKVLLVEDGDTVEFSGQKTAIGVEVRGGNLIYSREGDSAWFGSSGALPFVQSGGTTTVYSARSSIDSYDASSGALLLWNNAGSYAMTVSGGRFEIPSGYLMFWGNGAVCTVTNEGVFAARGVAANAATAGNRRLHIVDGGRFELGDIGICKQAPAIAVSGGVLAATADASIRSSITLKNATIAVAPGCTLAFAAAPSAIGTLTIEGDGCEASTTMSRGTVDLGTNRLAGVALDERSFGRLAFAVTDEELAAGEVRLIPFGADALPEGLTFSLRDGSGVGLTGAGRVEDGWIVFAVRRTAVTLPKPAAVWNRDFADGDVRGEFVLGLGGNALADNGDVVIGASASGVSVMHMSGLPKDQARFIAVVAISNVTDAAEGGALFTVRSSGGNPRTGVYNGSRSFVGLNGAADYGLDVSPSGRCYPRDGATHILGAYYSTDKVANIAELGGKGTFASVDAQTADVVSAGKSGLVYSNDARIDGFTFGGFDGASTRQLTGARIGYIAFFTNVQETATSVISSWSLDAMTAAETPADGGSVSGGANVGVNLSGGTVTVASGTTAAALFVQADTTLVFAEGATLRVVGPLYIADGATLTVKTAREERMGRTLVSTAAVAGDIAPQVACGMADAACYSVTTADGAIRIEYTPETLPVNAPVSIPVFDGAVAVELPVVWLTNHYPEATSLAAVTNRYLATGANGYAVWSSYLLGLDPTDVDAKMTVSCSIGGGNFTVTVEGVVPQEVAGVSFFWSLQTSESVSFESFGVADRAYGPSPVFASQPMASGTRFYRVVLYFVDTND